MENKEQSFAINNGYQTEVGQKAFIHGFTAGANHIKSTHVPLSEVEKIFESQSAGLEKSQKIFAEAAPNRTNPFDALISNNNALLNQICNLIKPQ